MIKRQLQGFEKQYSSCTSFICKIAGLRGSRLSQVEHILFHKPPAWSGWEETGLCSHGLEQVGAHLSQCGDWLASNIGFPLMVSITDKYLCININDLKAPIPPVLVMLVKWFPLSVLPVVISHSRPEDRTTGGQIVVSYLGRSSSEPSGYNLDIYIYYIYIIYIIYIYPQ